MRRKLASLILATAVPLGVMVTLAPEAAAAGTCASMPQVTATTYNGTYAAEPATLTVAFYDPDQCVVALNAQFFNAAGEVIGTSNATIVNEGPTTKAIAGWTPQLGANKTILTGTYQYDYLYCPIQLSQPCYTIVVKREVRYPIITIGTFEQAPPPPAPVAPDPTQVCLSEPGAKAKCVRGNTWSSTHCWATAKTVTARLEGGGNGAAAATDKPSRSKACPKSRPFQSRVSVDEIVAGDFKYTIGNGDASYRVRVHAE